MSDSAEDRTLEASARKLGQARERGDVPISREGSAAAIYLAALIGILLTAGLTLQRIVVLLVPLLDQPDEMLNFTTEGLEQVGLNMAKALALAILPFFGLLVGGALLPHVLGGSLVVTLARFRFQPSHLSPLGGLKRVFNPRGLFEFGKSLVKALVVGFTSYLIARPLYENSIGLVSADISVLLTMVQNAVVALLSAATAIAVVIAGVDIPYQHLMYRRRMRMSVQEAKDEYRNTEGDPVFKNKMKRLRRQRARRRMMQQVPKATVVIANPTHFAVALRYQRGKDAAPVVVAKGVDLVALRIRQTAVKHNVAVVENPPLARALYAAVELNGVIPQDHFEAVAKIIGLIWAQRKGKGLPVH